MTRETDATALTAGGAPRATLANGAGSTAIPTRAQARTHPLRHARAHV